MEIQEMLDKKELLRQAITVLLLEFYRETKLIPDIRTTVLAPSVYGDDVTFISADVTVKL